MKPIYVPKYLDEPFKFLVWTYPELIIVMGPFVVGLIFKQMLAGLFFSCVMGFVLKKCQPLLKGVSFHGLLYWYLPHTSISLPPSYIREYLG